MKKCFIVLQLFFCVITFSQNKKILYGFDKIPQTLLLNPGAETTFKYHIGVPLLSGVSANVNTSGITVADLFRENKLGIFEGPNFSYKLKRAIDKLSDDDYAHINAQVDVLNFGLKINYRDYLSAGFYLEADMFTSYPKDLAILATEGNSEYMGKVFSVGQAAVKGDVLGVWHVGVSRRINSRLSAGARLKVYTGALNVTSTDNSGGFSTHFLDENRYEHVLSGLDASVQTSGIYNEEDKADVSLDKVIKKSFFSSNIGLGLDLGFTYHIDEQSEITGSLLDLGFVSYATKTKHYKVDGNYIFSGLEVDVLNGSPNLWNKYREEINRNIHREEYKGSYTVMRPLKGYAAYSYSFGKSKTRANCHDNTYKDFYDNTVGGQIYTVFQPQGMNFAFTGFYQRKISKYLNTKLTYTIDDFSYTNFGIGVSLNVWKLNIYGLVDNLFTITDVADGHTSSAQVGVNFIIN